MLEIEIYPDVWVEVQEINKSIGKYNPKALLLLIDELGELMSTSDSGSYDTVSDMRESMKAIGRLGRAAGTHLALATQKPNNQSVPSELKMNIQQSCGLGNIDSGASTILFDKDLSYKCKPEIKGRGFVINQMRIEEYQSYFSTKEKDFVYKTPPPGCKEYNPKEAAREKAEKIRKEMEEEKRREEENKRIEYEKKLKEEEMKDKMNKNIEREPTPDEIKKIDERENKFSQMLNSEAKSDEEYDSFGDMKEPENKNMDEDEELAKKIAELNTLRKMLEDEDKNDLDNSNDKNVEEHDIENKLQPNNNIDRKSSKLNLLKLNKSKNKLGINGLHKKQNKEGTSHIFKNRFNIKKK